MTKSPKVSVGQQITIQHPVWGDVRGNVKTLHRDGGGTVKIPGHPTPIAFNASDIKHDAKTAKYAKEAVPKLGTGGRFKTLEAQLAAKGAADPAALAAYIGRKKYGPAKFSALAHKAK